jgi:hypothetical protein
LDVKSSSLLMAQKQSGSACESNFN